MDVSRAEGDYHLTSPPRNCFPNVHLRQGKEVVFQMRRVPAVWCAAARDKGVGMGGKVVDREGRGV